MRLQVTSRTRSVVPHALADGRRELVAFARKRVGSAAEDVVQEASVRALEKADQLSEPGAARAWLFSIVRRLVAEEGRKRPTEELNEERPAENSEPPDACGCVMTQIQELAPAQALMLTRVVVDGTSVTELATELGITPNIAWVRLHRAREALRKQLKQHCGAESLRQCLGCHARADGLVPRGNQAASDEELGRGESPDPEFVRLLLVSPERT